MEIKVIIKKSWFWVVLIVMILLLIYINANTRRLEKQIKQTLKDTEYTTQISELKDLHNHLRSNQAVFNYEVNKIFNELRTICNKDTKGLSLVTCDICLKELSIKRQEVEYTLIDLWGISANKIIDKLELEENVKDLYDESIHRLNIKTQELTQEFLKLSEELNCNGNQRN